MVFKWRTTTVSRKRAIYWWNLESSQVQRGQFQPNVARNSLGGGTYKFRCSDEGSCHFPKDNNNEKAKMHWWHLEIFFSRTNGSILTKLRLSHNWIKMIQHYTNKNVWFFSINQRYGSIISYVNVFIDWNCFEGD